MSVNVAAHLVRIHIDGKPYESPQATTGEALYALANAPQQQKVFRKVEGSGDDQEVPRDATAIHLAENEHFYTLDIITVGVNGEPYETTETRLSFEELVKIAFPVPPTGTLIEFTVTYRDGPPANPKGTLTAGHSVKIQNKMKFDVTATDRS